MSRKQRSVEELGDAQRMRKSTMRDSLLRIFGVLPSRSCLRHRNPVDEVGRGEMPYEPFEKGVLMIRDGADAARRTLTPEKKVEMARNIHEFCVTLERYMLEPLAVQEETDVIPLLLLETKVQNAGDEAQDIAKVARTPGALLEVARKADETARISTRLANACWTAANKVGLTLVRGTAIQQAAR